MRPLFPHIGIILTLVGLLPLTAGLFSACANPSPDTLPAERFRRDAPAAPDFSRGESDRRAAVSLRSLPWVADGVQPSERKAVEWLRFAETNAPDLFRSLLEKPWVQAPAAPGRNEALRNLGYLLVDEPDAAGKIAAMPFLDTLEPHDPVTLDSLSRLAHRTPAGFRQVMAYPEVADGITDAEAPVAALLGGTAANNPEQLAALRDFSRVMVQRRTIQLPGAGPVTLAVLRTRPGADRSMELLEGAVRAVERFVGEPFPQPYVALFFAEALASPEAQAGVNLGSHMTITAVYDVDDGSFEAKDAGRIITHEVAHYYWHGGEDWLDEGMAELTASVIRQPGSGSPLTAANPPCSQAASLQEVERRNYRPEEAGYRCNYALGERMFHELYRLLGEEAFRAGAARLYRRLAFQRLAEGRPLGIGAVLTAFTQDNGVSSPQPAAVKAVTERWYTGAGRYDAWPFDTGPVVPQLPEVNGWIERAAVTLNPEQGKPVSRFSARQSAGPVYLQIEYSHDFSGPGQKLDFALVQLYQDGIPFGYYTFAIEAQDYYSGGVQWLSLGPAPPEPWAAGRYQAYLYHAGRKVAQVQFEVTP